jgi:hypothetical protein
MSTNSSAQLGIGRALRGLAVTWSALLLTLLLTCLVFRAMFPFAILLLVLGTGYILYLLIQLVLAKGKVLGGWRRHRVVMSARDESEGRVKVH